MLRNSLRRPLQRAFNCGICRIESLPKLSTVCNNGFSHQPWTTPYPQHITTPPTPFDVIVTKSSRNNLMQWTTSSTVADFFESIFNGILNLKRTFQPSLLRRKRKHGFLARIATKDGRQILNRRRTKGRRALCA